MKVTSLEIKRAASYEENAHQLRGIVTLTGEYGQTTVVLSPGAIARIFNIIKDEVEVTAKNNAHMAKQALKNAADEQSLLTHEVADGL
jgi:hypothetical protein